MNKRKVDNLMKSKRHRCECVSLLASENAAEYARTMLRDVYNTLDHNPSADDLSKLKADMKECLQDDTYFSGVVDKTAEEPTGQTSGFSPPHNVGFLSRLKEFFFGHPYMPKH